MSAGEPRGWHRALAYAVLGRDLDGWGQQSAPDPGVLLAGLDELPGGIDALRTEVGHRRQAGEVWPHPVPAELTAGLGFAQFAAALRSLVSRLEPASPPVRGASRPLSADERRLLADVPPHHGA